MAENDSPLVPFQCPDTPDKSRKSSINGLAKRFPRKQQTSFEDNWNSFLKSHSIAY